MKINNKTYSWPKAYKLQLLRAVFATTAGGLFLLLAILPAALPQKTWAATRTWDGGGGADTNWSTCANWSTNICPVAGDTVVFDNTSDNNSTVDPAFPGNTVTTININAGYDGTITLGTTLDVNSNFTQASGIFTGTGQNLRVGGTFTLSAGTFNAPANVTFDGGVSSVLSCNNATFTSVTFAHTGNTTKTVGSNCDLPLGNSPIISLGQNNADIALNGTLSGTGTLIMGTAGPSNVLTIHSTGVLSGFSGLQAGAVTISGATFDASSYTTFDLSGAFTMDGTFTAPSGIATFASTFNLFAGSTFNHNGGTITFDGTTTATITCNNKAFNLVTFNHTGNNTKTVDSTCSLPLGSDPTVGSGNAADIVLNGTLSGSGTLTIAARNGGNILTLNSTADLSGFSGLATGSVFAFGVTLDASSYTTFIADGFFTQATGGGNITVPNGADFNNTVEAAFPGDVFNAPSGTMTMAGTLNISSGFSHNNGTVTFDGTDSVTLDCNDATFNRVTFAHTSGTKTVDSTCDFPLGANSTQANSGNIVLEGTFSGSGSLTFADGILQLNPGYSLSGFSGLNTNDLTVNGATANFGSYNTFDVDDDFVLQNNASFTAPNANMTVGGDLVVNTGSSFNHNNGAVILDGGNQQLVGNTVFNNLSKSVSTAGTLTMPADNTTTILGTLTLQGANGQLLTIVSSGPPTTWLVDAVSSDVDFVAVSDSQSIGNTIVACDSVDNGNNSGWSFNPPSCAGLIVDDDDESIPPLIDSVSSVANFQFLQSFFAARSIQPPVIPTLPSPDDLPSQISNFISQIPGGRGLITATGQFLLACLAGLIALGLAFWWLAWWWRHKHQPSEPDDHPPVAPPPQNPPSYGPPPINTPPAGTVIPPNTHFKSGPPSRPLA